jgi:hypothetical protein
MNKWLLTLATLAGLAAGEAFADGMMGPKHASPFSAHKGGSYNSYGRQLPVFLAAPWYLYWPYDAHFMTPAPVYGAYYAPPMMGNYPVQPYFPIPQYVPPTPAPMSAPAIAAPPIGQ